MGNSHGTVFLMELTEFVCDNDKDNDNDKTKIMSCPVVPEVPVVPVIDKQPSSTDEAKDEAKDFNVFCDEVHADWGNP
tara:strand:+ start:214 stop:447 length:234 start_codon:yes stop_codon:yes gene_type:complete